MERERFADDFPEDEDFFVFELPDFFDPDDRDDDFFDDDFFGEDFFEEDFFEEDFFEEDLLDDFFDEDFFDEDLGGGGTLPPSRRASERPMAIACFLLFTFRPEPLRSFPSFSSCIFSSTLSCAFFPYLLAIQKPPAQELVQAASPAVHGAAMEIVEGASTNAPRRRTRTSSG